MNAWEAGVKFSGATLLLSILLMTLLCVAQYQPVPPGMRHAQELQAQSETTANPRAPVDPVSLRREAEQLAALAASLPTDVQKANQGIVSKDLIPRLKEIEKLSKHLRNELNH
jgi:hypothetical protein